MSFRKRVDSLLKGFEKTFSTYNRIEVSRSALLHNLALLQQVGQKPVIPVLKGNAYGHGIDVVAYALKDEPLPYLAVDGYFEALRIREVSRQPILVMGAIKPENFQYIKYDNMAFVVHDPTVVAALAKTGRRIKVHLECNTGMNRYGVRPEDVAAMTRTILQHSNLELEGIMSHLADADGTDPATVQAADDSFDLCVEEMRRAGGRPTMIHVAQSAGSISSTSKYANMIRSGIGLYGINPFPFANPARRRLHSLHPAMRLTSTITQIHELEKGEAIGYNYTFTAPRRMRIGILPLGYYEGIDRRFSNTGAVKSGEKYLPIVGNVCMNHTMVSLGVTNLAEGDEVTIYSNITDDKNSIERLAAAHGIASYELLTGLNQDVRRLLLA